MLFAVVPVASVFMQLSSPVATVVFSCHYIFTTTETTVLQQLLNVDDHFHTYVEMVVMLKSCLKRLDWWMGMPYTAL